MRTERGPRASSARWFSERCMHQPSASMRRWTPPLLLAGGGCVLIIFGAGALWAAEQPARGSGNAEALFIVQIVLLLLVGRLLGEAMQRIGQPAVIGQLIAGMLL